MIGRRDSRHLTATILLELVDDAGSGPLDDARRHLSWCARCRAEATDLALTVGVLRRSAPEDVDPLELPDLTWDRVRRRMNDGRRTAFRARAWLTGSLAAAWLVGILVAPGAVHRPSLPRDETTADPGALAALRTERLLSDLVSEAAYLRNVRLLDSGTTEPAAGGAEAAAGPFLVPDPWSWKEVDADAPRGRPPEVS